MIQVKDGLENKSKQENSKKKDQIGNNLQHPEKTGLGRFVRTKPAQIDFC
jgi:hypothetical protein